MKKTRTRVFSILLACALVLGMMPMGVFAVTETNSSTEVIEVSNATNLLAAIDEAQDERTIKLMGDIAVNLPDFTAVKNLTFDLNSQTLTMTNAQGISVDNGARVTFKNGKIISNELAGQANEAVIGVTSGSIVTLDRIEFETDVTGLLVRGDAAELNIINQSAIRAKGFCFGTNAADENNYNVKINLKDSTFTGSAEDGAAGTAMYINVPGNLDIDNCTINGYFHGLIVRGGTAEIKNSTIINYLDDSSNASYFEGKDWGSGNKVNLAALTLGNKISSENNPYNYPTEVTLVNTTITSAGEAASSYPAIYAWANSDPDNGVNISYDNCTINGKIVYGNGGKNIEATILSGAAKINEQSYLTLADAIAKAEEGQTVTLTKDNVFSETISINTDKEITLDLNGKKAQYTGTGTYAIELSEGSDLTVKDSAGSGILTAPNRAIKVGGGTIKTAGTSATLTLNGGTIESTNEEENSAIAVYANNSANRNDDSSVACEVEVNEATVKGGIYVFGEGAKLTVNDGAMIDTDGYYGISGNGTNNSTQNNGDTVININGGTIKQTGAGGGAIYHPQDGTLNISGNAVITGDSGIQLCSGEGVIANITGGTITATGSDQREGKTGDGFIPDGAAVSVVNRSYPGGTPKMSISGGYFVSHQSKSVMAYTWSNNEASDWEDAKTYFTISGGYFTSDPSEYVADGKAALTSDKDGYAFVVGKAVTDANAAPAAGDPVVDMSAIPEDSQDDVKKAAESVKDNGALAAAANQAIGEVTDQQVADATAALNDTENVEVGEQDDVTVYAQTYLDIKPTAYDSENKIMTLDITPMYRVVASTAKNASDIKVVGEVTNDANAVVLENSETKLDIQTMTISITLPSGFASSDAPLYVNHTKNGRTYVYTGNVGEDNVLTFTNPHGFSEFTITSEGPVAKLNGVGYTSLTDAVNDAKDGDTVTILKDGLTASMSGSSRTITLANGVTDSPIKVTINGTKIDIVDNGNKDYTYTRPSSSGGGTIETKYDISVDSAANGTVKASASTSAKDKTVTLTVTPDEGYVLDTLTVTDRDGKNVELTKKSDTEYTFQMPSSKVTVKAVFKEEAAESTLPFTDVSGADWFYPAVKYVYDNDMMDGVGGSLFAPASQLTRGMIAQVLYNLEKATGDFNGSFTDVAADEWYADAVNWAAECGIVNGFGDGTFGPEQNITREQMAQILMNYAKYKGYDMTAKGDVSAFTDAAEISGWAQDAVSWAVGEKLLSGKGNGILDPAGTATRAEVAQIFMNFCENIAK